MFDKSELEKQETDLILSAAAVLGQGKTVLFTKLVVENKPIVVEKIFLDGKLIDTNLYVKP